MKRGGRGLEEIDQALVQLFAHKLLQTAMAGVYRSTWAVASLVAVGFDGWPCGWGYIRFLWWR
jgi:hypothetical protein